MSPPALWRPDEHEALTEGTWDPVRVRAAIDAIVADADGAVIHDCVWPGHPLDDLRDDELVCSLYLGAAGVIWAFSRLGGEFDCTSAVNAALDRYRAAPDFDAEAHPPSLLMGEAGLLVVAATVGARAADADRLDQLIRANRVHPTWELMWGSPGTILAGKACGLQDAWRDSAEVLAERWDPASDMWPHELYGR